MAEYSLPPVCQASAPGAPAQPAHPGQWVLQKSIVSLRLCSLPGWPSTLGCTPRSHAAAVPGWCSLAPTCRQHRWCRWGAFPGSRNSPSERLPRVRTAASQANAFRLQPAPAGRCLSSSSPPSKAPVPTPEETAAQPPSPPRPVLWLEDLQQRTHSQFFSISPNCSCSPEKSSSRHNNPEERWQHHIPLHTSGAQHEAAATSPAKASLKGHIPAPDDDDCQQQTLRDDCQV